MYFMSKDQVNKWEVFGKLAEKLIKVTSIF